MHQQIARLVYVSFVAVRQLFSRELFPLLADLAALDAIGFHGFRCLLGVSMSIMYENMCNVTPLMDINYSILMSFL